MHSQASKILGGLAFFAIASLSVVGCAADIEPGEEMDSAESEMNGARSVSLKYEGTCEFLRSCSSYSKNLPKGKVTWGCTGVGACSDTARWVAGPNRSYCGKTVKICKGSTCTDALVKDVSVSRDWEASNGVLDALDLPFGLKGKCGGFGGGKVTVEVGGKASSATAPGDDGDDGDSDDDDTTVRPKPRPEPTTDDGCFSATLQKDMPELSCVQSKSTQLYYQCKSGDWYRGVRGTTGPYGECESMHSL